MVYYSLRAKHRDTFRLVPIGSTDPSSNIHIPTNSQGIAFFEAVPQGYEVYVRPAYTSQFFLLTSSVAEDHLYLRTMNPLIDENGILNLALAVNNLTVELTSTLGKIPYVGVNDELTITVGNFSSGIPAGPLDQPPTIAILKEDGTELDTSPLFIDSEQEDDRAYDLALPHLYKYTYTFDTETEETYQFKVNASENNIESTLSIETTYDKTPPTLDDTNIFITTAAAMPSGVEADTTPVTNVFLSIPEDAVDDGESGSGPAKVYAQPFLVNETGNGLQVISTDATHYHIVDISESLIDWINVEGTGSNPAYPLHIYIEANGEYYIRTLYNSSVEGASNKILLSENDNTLPDLSTGSYNFYITRYSVDEMTSWPYSFAYGGNIIQNITLSAGTPSGFVKTLDNILYGVFIGAEDNAGNKSVSFTDLGSDTILYSSTTSLAPGLEYHYAEGTAPSSPEIYTNENGWFNPDTLFLIVTAFDASGNQGDTFGVQYNIGGAAWVDADPIENNDSKFYIDLQNIGEGARSFQIRTYDIHSEAGTPYPIQYKWDHTAPYEYVDWSPAPISAEGGFNRATISWINDAVDTSTDTQGNTVGHSGPASLKIIRSELPGSTWETALNPVEVAQIDPNQTSIIDTSFPVLDYTTTLPTYIYWGQPVDYAGNEAAKGYLLTDPSGVEVQPLVPADVEGALRVTKSLVESVQGSGTFDTVDAQYGISSPVEAVSIQYGDASSGLLAIKDFTYIPASSESYLSLMSDMYYQREQVLPFHYTLSSANGDSLTGTTLILDGYTLTSDYTDLALAEGVLLRIAINGSIYKSETLPQGFFTVSSLINNAGNANIGIGSALSAADIAEINQAITNGNLEIGLLLEPEIKYTFNITPKQGIHYWQILFDKDLQSLFDAEVNEVSLDTILAADLIVGGTLRLETGLSIWSGGFVEGAATGAGLTLDKTGLTMFNDSMEQTVTLNSTDGTFKLGKNEHYLEFDSDGNLTLVGKLHQVSDFLPEITYTFRGTWNVNATYSTGDVVGYAGSYFYWKESIADGNTADPPYMGATEWGLYASGSMEGAASQSFSIVTSSQIFTYNGDGQLLTSEPIHIIANNQNITLDTFDAPTAPTQWETIGTLEDGSTTSIRLYRDSSLTNQIPLDPANDDSGLDRNNVYINPLDFNSGVDPDGNAHGALTSLQINAWAEIGETTPSWTDSITVYKLQEGTDAYSVLLSNETHAEATDNDGSGGNWDDAITTISLFKGTTLVDSHIELSNTTVNWTSNIESGNNTTGPIISLKDVDANSAYETGIVDIAVYDNTLVTDPDSYDYNNDSLGALVTTKTFSVSRIREGALGASGTDARAVNLTLTDQSIEYNTEGAAPDPSSVTVTATAVNTDATATIYYEFIVEDTTKQNNNSNTYTYTPPTSYSTLPNKIEVKIRENSDNSDVLATDQITVIGMMAGSDAVTILLSNEAHTLPETNTGDVTYTGSGTNIEAWIGTTQLTYDDTLTTTNSFKVVASATNITAGTPTTQGDITRQYPDASAIIANSATIAYTITVKNDAEVTQEFIKYQSFAKSTEGADATFSTVPQITSANDTLMYDTEDGSAYRILETNARMHIVDSSIRQDGVSIVENVWTASYTTANGTPGALPIYATINGSTDHHSTTNETYQEVWVEMPGAASGFSNGQAVDTFTSVNFPITISVTLNTNPPTGAGDSISTDITAIAGPIDGVAGANAIEHAVANVVGSGNVIVQQKGTTITLENKSWYEGGDSGEVKWVIADAGIIRDSGANLNIWLDATAAANNTLTVGSTADTYGTATITLYAKNANTNGSGFTDESTDTWTVEIMNEGELMGSYIEKRFFATQSATEPADLDEASDATALSIAWPPSITSTTSTQVLTGWEMNIPTETLGEGWAVWETQCEFKANGDPLDTPAAWTTPVLSSYLGTEGQAGDPGPAITFTGPWDAARTYVKSSQLVECVVHEIDGADNYFIANQAQGVNNTNYEPTLPPDEDYWSDFGAQFTSVATGFLLAEKIAAGDIIAEGSISASLLTIGAVGDLELPSNATALFHFNGSLQDTLTNQFPIGDGNNQVVEISDTDGTGTPITYPYLEKNSLGGFNDAFHYISRAENTANDAQVVASIVPGKFGNALQVDPTSSNLFDKTNSSALKGNTVWNNLDAVFDIGNGAYAGVYLSKDFNFGDTALSGLTSSGSIVVNENPEGLTTTETYSGTLTINNNPETAPVVADGVIVVNGNPETPSSAAQTANNAIIEVLSNPSDEVVTPGVTASWRMNMLINCVLEGTLCEMHDGSTKPVEELQITDVIKSYSIDGLSHNEEDGTWPSFTATSLENNNITSSEIKNIKEYETTHYIKINNDLKVTASHYLWALDAEDSIWKWKKAGELSTNFSLLTSELTVDPIISLEEIETEVPIKTFSLDVETVDTVFFGSYLSHNDFNPADTWTGVVKNGPLTISNSFTIADDETPAQLRAEVSSAINSHSANYTASNYGPTQLTINAPANGASYNGSLTTNGSGDWDTFLGFPTNQIVTGVNDTLAGAKTLLVNDPGGGAIMFSTAEGESIATVATNIETALNNDANITSLFTVSRAGGEVFMTPNGAGASYNYNWDSDPSNGVEGYPNSFALTNATGGSDAVAATSYNYRLKRIKNSDDTDYDYVSASFTVSGDDSTWTIADKLKIAIISDTTSPNYSATRNGTSVVITGNMPNTQEANANCTSYHLGFNKTALDSDCTITNPSGGVNQTSGLYGISANNNGATRTLNNINTPISISGGDSVNNIAANFANAISTEVDEWDASSNGNIITVTAISAGASSHLNSITTNSGTFTGYSEVQAGTSTTTGTYQVTIDGVNLGSTFNITSGPNAEPVIASSIRDAINTSADYSATFNAPYTVNIVSNTFGSVYNGTLGISPSVGSDFTLTPLTGATDATTETYTVSFWARNNTSNTLNLQWYWTGDSSDVIEINRGTHVPVAAGETIKIEQPLTVNTEITNLRIEKDNANSGFIVGTGLDDIGQWQIWDVQVEELPYATAYMDHGYTRPDGKLKYRLSDLNLDVTAEASWGIGGWFKPNKNLAESTGISKDRIGLFEIGEYHKSNYTSITCWLDANTSDLDLILYSDQTSCGGGSTTENFTSTDYADYFYIFLKYEAALNRFTLYVKSADSTAHSSITDHAGWQKKEFIASANFSLHSYPIQDTLRLGSYDWSGEDGNWKYDYSSGPIEDVVLLQGEILEETIFALGDANKEIIERREYTTIDGGKITTGTLDASKVAVTNLNASNISAGQLESTNWSNSAGSKFWLNNGSFKLGGSSAPKLEWNGTTLSVEGSINITGGTAQTTIQDAQDAAANAQNTADNLSLNALEADTPAGAGLFMDATHLGYYNSSLAGNNKWATYMDNTGNFYLRNDNNSGLSWDSSSGTLIIGNSGGGHITLDSSGSAYFSGDITSDATITGGTLQTTNARTSLNSATTFQTPTLEAQQYGSTGASSEETINYEEDGTPYWEWYLACPNKPDNIIVQLEAKNDDTGGASNSTLDIGFTDTSEAQTKFYTSISTTGDWTTYEISLTINSSDSESLRLKGGITPYNTGGGSGYGGWGGTGLATTSVKVRNVKVLSYLSQVKLNEAGLSIYNSPLNFVKIGSNQAEFKTPTTFRGELRLYGDAWKTGEPSWYGISDKRLKKDINIFNKGLDILNQINPITYKYNKLVKTENPDKTYVGIIAQDIIDILPEAIDFKKEYGFEDLQVYNHNSLIYVLVNAVKELNEKIKKLEER